MLFDGTTGVPSIIMFDNGLLTHHRTGAAGAVAAKYLSREDSSVALIIGTGTQGRLQLDYLTRVRALSKVLVRDVDEESVNEYIGQAKKKHPEIQFESVPDLSAACGEADIIVTATPSRAPILEADWVKPGTHINAIGSDNPGKQELAPELLGNAIYVTDSTPQCARNGELQHAVAAGVMGENDVHCEIGAIVDGARPGRADPADVTIFDSTGLGAQDLAIANYVFESSREK
jgi:ornithine cyclodeaminase/alanine dehydrogenase-like protein (mu-crystallin family)